MNSFPQNIVLYPWEFGIDKGKAMLEYLGYTLNTVQQASNGSILLNVTPPLGKSMDNLYEEAIGLGYRVVPFIFVETPPVSVPPAPPAPVQDWLYMVEVISAVFIRDSSGNLFPEASRTISPPIRLKIYQELSMIGPNAQGLTYTNRGVINKSTGDNIWLSTTVVRRL